VAKPNHSILTWQKRAGIKANMLWQEIGSVLMRHWFHSPDVTNLDELRDQASKLVRQGADVCIHKHKFNLNLCANTGTPDEEHEVYNAGKG